MNILKWLSVTDRFSKVYLDNQFAQFGINSSQYLYILKICDCPGILQESLIESIYVHPSNIVRTVSALEVNSPINCPGTARQITVPMIIMTLLMASVTI